jgi:uncharacterized RDD family membrane protein YckC
MQTPNTLTPADAAPVTIAGAWRRLFVFVIDMLVLGALGMVLGWLFHERFAALGAWGRAVGFLVAVAYFGCLESRRGGGSSLGKRMLGLQVVTRTGATLSMPAAFGRTAIFCLAYFLNGVSLTTTPGQEWITVIQSVFIGVLIISMFYLLLFNRRTRQSLHDLAVGAYVVKVRARPGAFAVPALPVWRGHYAIVGATILALSVGGLLLVRQPTMASLLATQQALSALPDVRAVSVTANVQLTGQARTRRLLIGGIVDASLGDPDGLAATMASVALDTYPEAKSQQQIVVTLTSGYDIGIASSWRWTNYAWTPAQWRALAKKQSI